jgi:hypothetical protein
VCAYFVSSLLGSAHIPVSLRKNSSGTVIISAFVPVALSTPTSRYAPGPDQPRAETLAVAGSADAPDSSYSGAPQPTRTVLGL